MNDNLSPAQEAWFDDRKDYGSWPEPELAQAHKHFIAGYEAALLAAHPAPETVTEWGVQWAGEDYVTEYQPSDKATVTSAYKADIAWARRNAIRTPPKGELVSREVTAWKPAES